MLPCYYISLFLFVRRVCLNILNEFVPVFRWLFPSPDGLFISNLNGTGWEVSSLSPCPSPFATTPRVTVDTWIIRESNILYYICSNQDASFVINEDYERLYFVRNYQKMSTFPITVYLIKSVSLKDQATLVYVRYFVIFKMFATI